MGLLSDASPFRVEQHQRSEAIRIDSLENPITLFVVRNTKCETRDIEKMTAKTVRASKRGRTAGLFRPVIVQMLSVLKSESHRVM